MDRGAGDPIGDHGSRALRRHGGARSRSRAFFATHAPEVPAHLPHALGRAGGSATRVTARLTNVSGHPIATCADRCLKIRALRRDGALSHGARPFGFPRRCGRTLQPDAPCALFVWNTAVRWSGPLHIQATCSRVAGPTHAATIDVTSAVGHRPRPSAVDDAAVSFPGSPSGQPCLRGPPASFSPRGHRAARRPARSLAHGALLGHGHGRGRLRRGEAPHGLAPDDAPRPAASFWIGSFRIAPPAHAHAPNSSGRTVGVRRHDPRHRSFGPLVALGQSKAFGKGPGAHSTPSAPRGFGSPEAGSICGSSKASQGSRSPETSSRSISSPVAMGLPARQAMWRCDMYFSVNAKGDTWQSPSRSKDRRI